MQNRSMNSNPATITQSLLCRPEEPVGELPPAFLRFHLLIIFKIITDNEPRPFPPPLPATDLLLCAPRQNAKLMPIRTLHDDVGLLLLDEVLDLEVPPEELVLSELHRNIPQPLYRHLLAGSHADDVLFNAKADIREDVIICESCRLRMISWCCQRTSRTA